MKKRVQLTVLGLVLGVLILMIQASEPTHAAGLWYVAPDGDDGNSCTSAGSPCATINGAIAKASAGDTIYVAVGTYTGTSDEVVLIDKDITLSGGWDAGFGVRGSSSVIDGERSRRGISVSAGVTATIEHLAIVNGTRGITNHGTLTLNSSEIHKNGYTYDIYAPRGGITNYGTLALNNSTVSNNRSMIAGDGGGITNGTGHSGGEDATLILNNCTVSGNTAHGRGGGIANWGSCTLYNCTISGNEAGNGGGIWQLRGTVDMRNTILAGNSAAIAPDCDGAMGSAGHNLVGNTSGCGFIPSSGDLTDVSPGLGKLVGAPDAPQYHPLLAGSPAIDAGNPSGCTGSEGLLLADQRGAARAGQCDIGAYEYTDPTLPATVHALSGTPQRTPPSLPFRAPLQAVVLDSLGTPVEAITVTFSAPESGASGIFADSGTPTATVLTDGSGVAAVALSAADGLTGSYTVTAVVSGIMTPANFVLGNYGWYVSPDGDDADDCQTPETPCATIDGPLGKGSFTGQDTVLVATGTYTGTGSQVVLLNRDAILSGGWDSTFAVQKGTSTIDGEQARRGITVDSDVTAVIERSTVQNGSVGVNGFGGGIINGGTLTLNYCSVHGNAAGRDGGGIENGGLLMLNHSTITSNASGYGGGIRNANSVAVLNHSTISGNTAGSGGGIYNYGHSALTVNSSAVSGNAAETNGGGISGGTVVLNSSSVSGNTATWSGGGYWGQALVVNNSTVGGNAAGNNGGGIFKDSGGLVTLNSSTIGGNMAGDSGGGIFVYGGDVTLQNTVLAGNTAASGPDCSNYGTIGSAGHNLIGDTSDCDLTPDVSDLVDVDARLGPREGTPSHHPLLFGSPAINAGNPAGCTDSQNNPLPFDQRAMPRVGTCDIGAVETQELETSTKSAGASTSAPGVPFTYTIALRNVGSVDVGNVVVTDTVPPALTYQANSLDATSGSYDYTSGVITWAGSISANATVTITYGVAIHQTALLGTSIANSAIISGGGEVITRTAAVTVEDQICGLTKYMANPVLSVGAGGSWDDDGVWGPAVLKEDGIYLMWYTGADGAGPSQIGLATSTDGVNWTREASNPVLSPSRSWETQGVRAGSVISDGGVYRMWYTGYDGQWVARIGYATSPDGVTWTKHDGNPVLEVGVSGSWEDGDVRRPAVIRVDGAYHMWYAGYDGTVSRIGHATSSNGSSWVRDPANPVLDVGVPGGWDWLGVYGPSVVAYNDVYLLWYSGESLPLAWQTGYALSIGGNGWVRKQMLIPEGPHGDFDAYSADYASVIADGARFKVWYSGHNGARYTIGYATADMCGEPGTLTPPHVIYLPVTMQNFDPQYSCPAYYSDRFDDPASGWPVADSSDRRYDYVGGEYQVWVKQPSQGWMVTPGAKATDFAVAVSARRASGTRGAYGVIFGINENWSEYYEIIVDMNYYSVWKNDNGSWTALQNWTQSSHIGTGTAWNRLKVIRDRATIAFYANNQHLTTVTDGSFTGFRRIGLVAYSPSDGPLDARFDDFTLYPATCGIGAATVGFEMGLPEVQQATAHPGLDSMPSNRESAR